MADKILRLILGDQLNASHSWFKQQNDTVTYLIAELHQETAYVKHHTQKVCAFFIAMEQFAQALKAAGHNVLHMTLDDTQNYQSLPELLEDLLSRQDFDAFEYQAPDEYRLNSQLQTFCQALKLPTLCVDTEHFFLDRDELSTYFTAGKHNRMESFYRRMRKRFSILMEDDEPAGGRWNYDSDNRNSFKTDELASIPAPLLFSHSTKAVLERLSRHKVNTFGRCEAQLPWPCNRVEARQLLHFFCEHLLPHFGTFQDAMTSQSEHAWSLYHSRLSFALNSKILSPHEVIDAAIAAFYRDTDNISLSQIEGFVRQILGWREYVRGMYWVNMPDYTKQNALNANRALPHWFWTGDTKMHCLQHAIKQSLDHAYAHHIQRLMLTGNFALLAGLNPDEVDAWYLGIYVDAIEWVELPNTRGMALFADGGWIATKPYAASGNYINKMSDYCKHCHYKVKQKTEASACPFNSLYWHFIDQHHDTFKRNPRLSFPVKQWEKQSPEAKEATLTRAKSLLENIDDL